MFLSKKQGNNKDVEKNEKQSGFSLFKRVLKERYLDLISLNLIFLLYCLPIITIGPAIKAMSKVTMDLARDQLVSPVYDFRQEFKRDFLNTTLVSLGFFGGFVVMTISLRYYLATLQSSVLMSMAVLKCKKIADEKCS